MFSHWDAVAPIVAQANMRLDDDGSEPNHNDKHHIDLRPIIGGMESILMLTEFGMS